ncbi:hypothetical protein [Maliponia aquimaris]|uniref:Uncharacterized protein n=1 Tax=Maliponia aquimaris TaxID=1673631 RepID=A0A238KAD8_9RHOB|nr:hypothetical protein [Maliponia aquimaris]SMX38936.1 hypothetical protein MAA8898_01795 [Maliponia aquimaris]
MFRLACLLTAVVLGAAAPAGAADLVLVSYRFSDETPVPHLHLSGPLEKEDATVLPARFAQLMACSGGLCWQELGPRAVVTLDSPGGSYATGVALADFFRSEAVATYIDAGDTCLSACGLAFLGGSAFWPTGGIGTYIDRRVAPGGRLGFHSPYFTLETAEQAVRSGQLGALLNGTRLAIADIVETLSRYNVSQTVLHEIIRMGPDAFYEVSTPRTLAGIRASLPGFDPALLGLGWREQFDNLCRHLAAAQYAVAPEVLEDLNIGDPLHETAEDGTPILLFGLEDRPLNVSGCGLPADREGQPLDYMALYAWNGDPDNHRTLLEFQNSNTGGWSTFAYRGGRATDGYVTQGSLNHLLMPLDSDLSRLPGAALDQIDTTRARSAAPRLPSHSLAWPATLTHETPWSRSYEGAGLVIVEQTGPAHLFDDIVTQAEGTTVMYEFDRPDTVIRSGEDAYQGTSYYWLAFRSGDRAATLRIQAPVPAAGLNTAQKDLMGLVACSVDFEGLHLGCYR